MEIERLRGLLENAGGGEEKVGELESENGQLHKTVKELTEDLAKSQGKSEEMMNHFANVIEQTKTIRLALMTKDSEIMRLQVGATIQPFIKMIRDRRGATEFPEHCSMSGQYPLRCERDTTCNILTLCGNNEIIQIIYFYPISYMHG